MWLKAEELWLMTPNSILPWKNRGATTAAGSICIKNLRAGHWDQPCMLHCQSPDICAKSGRDAGLFVLIHPRQASNAVLQCHQQLTISICIFSGRLTGHESIWPPLAERRSQDDKQINTMGGSAPPVEGGEEFQIP